MFEKFFLLFLHQQKPVILLFFLCIAFQVLISFQILVSALRVACITTLLFYSAVQHLSNQRGNQLATIFFLSLSLSHSLTPSFFATLFNAHILLPVSHSLPLLPSKSLALFCLSPLNYLHLADRVQSDKQQHQQLPLRCV